MDGFESAAPAGSIGASVVQAPRLTLVPESTQPNRPGEGASSPHSPVAAHRAHRVGLVLQGGGSVAATQVGMLRAILEAGIRPDVVVGSSAGALNAVAFASDPTLAGIDRLERLWLSMRRRTVAPLSPRVVLAALRGRGSAMLPNGGLRSVLESADAAPTLQSTVLPVHVIATDLGDGSTVVLSEGDTVTALLASAAFPGLYPPVRVGDRYLIDGGVGADIPILQAEELGSTCSYVLPAAVSDQPETLPRGPLPLMFHAVSQLLDAAARRDLALTRAGSPVDFRGTADLIQQGYQLATQWLTAVVCPCCAQLAAAR
jgi:NTE family protein